MLKSIALFFTRAGFLDSLSRAAEFLDARPLLCVCIIAACFIPTIILESHSRLLSNDEIYTVHIAQQPTIGKMLALSREIDLHPPMHYILQRYALMLPFPRWLDARLPSLLAGLVACFAIWQFVSRRLGPLFGLLAAMTLWFGPLLGFTWSNRPYALWIAFLCLLLPARNAAVRLHRSWWSVPVVFLMAMGMVTSHLIGVLCLGPFLLAELYRARRNRRMDWPLFLAFAVPALIAIGFKYQFSHIAKDSFPIQQMPSFTLAIETYVVNSGTALQIIGIVLLLFFFITRPVAVAVPNATTRNSDLPFDTAELIIINGLLVLPLFVLLAGSIGHLQFWTRYGGAAAPAIAVLAAGLIASRIPLARPLAFVLVLCGMSFMVFLCITDTHIQTNAFQKGSGRQPIPLATLDASLPIVTASPMTFVEMSDREKPEIAHRVYYLTDVNEAVRFSHYTLFENEDKIRALLNLPSNAEPLNSFLPQHHKFYVVGDYSAPEIWLLRSLAASGMNLDYLGKFESSYESQDLYLVTH
jgi:hypothetical protein